jgi:hypothetical protein
MRVARPVRRAGRGDGPVERPAPRLGPTPTRTSRPGPASATRLSSSTPFPRDRGLAGVELPARRARPRRARDGDLEPASASTSRALSTTATGGSRASRSGTPSALPTRAPSPRWAPRATAMTVRRPRRDGQRPVQDRAHPGAGALADGRPGRARDRGVGGRVNDQRLHSACGDIPPAEFEAA